MAYILLLMHSLSLFPMQNKRTIYDCYSGQEYDIDQYELVKKAKEYENEMINASQAGQSERISDILTSFVPVNLEKTDTKGRSSLYFSCKYGCYASAHILLIAGADPNHCNVHGNTPLIAATKNSNAAIMGLLFAYNADYKHLNCKGKDARFYAKTQQVNEYLDFYEYFDKSK